MRNEVKLSNVARATGVPQRTLYEWKRTRRKLFDVLIEWYVKIYLPKTLNGEKSVSGDV